MADPTHEPAQAMSTPSKARGSTASRQSAASAPVESADAESRINDRIASLGDWRGETLAQLRAIIRAADPGIFEEWKWNTPVWSCSGLICTGETYKKAVKLTFAKGASVADPDRIFNSSLDGRVRRAVDFLEGAAIDASALQALIRRAVAVNRGGTRSRST